MWTVLKRVWTRRKVTSHERTEISHQSHDDRPLPEKPLFGAGQTDTVGPVSQRSDARATSASPTSLRRCGVGATAVRILYATDGSAPAKDARILIERIGDPKRDEVTVISVHNGHGSREASSSIAASAADALDLSGFDARSTSVSGSPADEIMRQAEKGAFDLIAMGSGTDTWLGGVLLGSVSMRVLHTAPCSLLVVHEFSGREPNRVMVGVDGSRHSDFALETFASFADAQRCLVSTLTVVHQPAPMAMDLPGVVPGQESDDELQEQLIERARRTAAHAARVLSDKGFKAAPVVTLGRASSQLLKEADAMGADLIVVGSRGLGALKRTVLGSVGDHVARHARAALIARGPHI
jgi:nucleotide-binding universal stress UspA family protein